MLREQGVEPEIVTYLENPPDAVTLRALLTAMGMAPRQLLRTREKEYKELGLNDSSVGDDEIIAAMAGHPRLIERPIVVNGDRAVLGRPTERVLEVLDRESVGRRG